MMTDEIKESDLDLNELLKRCGYRFRQHLEEAGWTAR